jgi:hypothetical protein
MRHHLPDRSPRTRRETDQCSRLRRRPSFGGIARNRSSTSSPAIRVCGGGWSAKTTRQWRVTSEETGKSRGRTACRCPAFVTAFGLQISPAGLLPRGRSGQKSLRQPRGNRPTGSRSGGEIGLDLLAFKNVVNVARFLAARRSAIDDVEVASGTSTRGAAGERREAVTKGGVVRAQNRETHFCSREENNDEPRECSYE